jgi:hypothetical protein
MWSLGAGNFCSNAEWTQVRRGRHGPGRCWCHRRPLKLEDFANLVWLLFATCRAPKIEHLAFLMLPRRGFFGVEVSFDACYEWRNWNWLPAVKTRDTTIRLHLCLLRHGDSHS